jgi:hypothetical protein
MNGVNLQQVIVHTAACDDMHAQPFPCTMISADVFQMFA